MPKITRPHVVCRRRYMDRASSGSFGKKKLQKPTSHCREQRVASEEPVKYGIVLATMFSCQQTRPGFSKYRASLCTENCTIYREILILHIVKSAQVYAMILTPSIHFFKWQISLLNNKFRKKHVAKKFEKGLLRRMLRRLTMVYWCQCQLSKCPAKSCRTSCIGLGKKPTSPP